jgi:hypothetical protein
MVLEGQMELTHEGIRSINLMPFDQDEFDGAWTTRSLGKCVDFNLMMVGCWGKLEAVCSQSLYLFEREVDFKAWEAFYCLSETIDITINIQDEVFSLQLNKGDFLLVSAKKGAYKATLSHKQCETFPIAVRATIQGKDSGQ